MGLGGDLARHPTEWLQLHACPTVPMPSLSQFNKEIIPVCKDLKPPFLVQNHVLLSFSSQFAFKYSAFNQLSTVKGPEKAFISIP
jgi:hypothetical protein